MMYRTLHTLIHACANTQDTSAIRLLMSIILQRTGPIPIIRTAGCTPLRLSDSASATREFPFRLCTPLPEDSEKINKAQKKRGHHALSFYG